MEPVILTGLTDCDYTYDIGDSGCKMVNHSK